MSSAASSSSSDEKNYTFTKGRAIIFNQVEFPDREDRRDGSEKDAADSKRVLEQFGFEVEIHPNLKTKMICQILENVSKEDHSDTDCLLIMMLTHGSSGGYLCTADGSILFKDICSNFTSKNCETLAGKPKLFFIQACRGDNFDYGVSFTRDLNQGYLAHNLEDTDCEQSKIVLPIIDDFLFMYATLEGNFAVRNKHGSWFIQALCKELETHENEDIYTILIGVNRHVAFAKQAYSDKRDYDALKQMPVIKSMLTKSLRFVKKINSN